MKQSKLRIKCLEVATSIKGCDDKTVVQLAGIIENYIWGAGYVDASNLKLDPACTSDYKDWEGNLIDPATNRIPNTEVRLPTRDAFEFMRQFMMKRAHGTGNNDAVVFVEKSFKLLYGAMYCGNA